MKAFKPIKLSMIANHQMETDLGTKLEHALENANDSITSFQIEGSYITTLDFEEQVIAAAALDYYGASHGPTIDTLNIIKFLEGKSDEFALSIIEGWYPSAGGSANEKALAEVIVAFFLRQGSLQTDLSSLSQLYSVFQNLVQNSTELSSEVQLILLENLKVQYEVLINDQYLDDTAVAEGKPRKKKNKACTAKVKKPGDCDTAYWECSGTGDECKKAADCTKANGDAGLYCDY